MKKLFYFRKKLLSKIIYNIALNTFEIEYSKIIPNTIFGILPKSDLQ